ncbi:MAG: acetyl ornithine aminotransferase family protein [candidate division WOR-3 bacterium]
MSDEKKKSKIPDIKQRVPGKNGSKIIEMEEKYLATTTKHLPLVIKKGKGSIVEDVDGNKFIDFTTGVCVTNIGIGHPKVIKAIKNQIKDFIYFAGTDFSYEVQANLAKRLTEITPGKFPKKVFFANSGAEAVEAAIKISKWSTKRNQFIGFIGGFHGRTMGANAFMGCKVVQRERYFPMMPGVWQLPYAYCYRCAYHEEYPKCDIWCAKIIEEVYFKQLVSPEEIAGILVEPIQGEGGYIVPPDEFIQELRKIATKYGILLIDDEVQTGLGRTGKFFAIEYTGVIPDIITMAKGLASGLPIGAAIYDAKFDFKVKGAHSNTFGGNPVCCASALATLEVIEEEQLVAAANEKGKYMKKRLEELKSKYEFIGDVRGRGMFIACEFITDPFTKKPNAELADYITEYCFQKGLVLMPCGFSSIRFVPALNIPMSLLEKGFGIFESACAEAANKYAKIKSA